MRPQFNPNSPKMEKKITRQFPRSGVASYFFFFWLYLSHFKSDFDEKKQKIGLLNEYNITSHLASHQLVSQNCRGYLFCYFWSYLSHFKSDFDWIKEKIGLLNQYNLTCLLGSHQLVSKDCCGQLFCYFWPYLSHFKSNFNGIREKISLLKKQNRTGHLTKLSASYLKLNLANPNSSLISA